MPDEITRMAFDPATVEARAAWHESMAQVARQRLPNRPLARMEVERQARLHEETAAMLRALQARLDALTRERDEWRDIAAMNNHHAHEAEARGREAGLREAAEIAQTRADLEVWREDCRVGARSIATTIRSLLPTPPETEESGHGE